MAQDTVKEDLPVLLITEGIGKGNQRVLREDELIIGRKAHCDMVVADRKVSREHARIWRKDDVYFIEDLGSRNGTYVNAKRIEEPTQLQEGDEISIALSIRIQYAGNEATAPLDTSDIKDYEQAVTEVEEEAQPLPQKGLQLDKRTRQVFINGEELDSPLSPYQYRLLELLYERQGGVCVREDVVKAVWPDANEVGVSEQAIDALVRRLRDKLSELAPEHQYIVTVRGFGFRLEQPYD